MNITEAYIFITKRSEEVGPSSIHHDVEIVWEHADIEDMFDDPKYVFVGTCQYNTEKKKVVSR